MSTGEGIDVGGIAQAVLIGVAQHFAASEIELPDRQVISPGVPSTDAWYCEMLTVNLGGIIVGQGPGQGGTARQTGPGESVGARHAIFIVQIVRCLPGSDDEGPPDAEAWTDAGLALMRDAGLLSQALVELCGKNGALRRSGMATAGAVEMTGPIGGMAAVEGNVTVTVKNLA